jgi:RNA polymerase sigma-70 factor (ECF subfamily)
MDEREWLAERFEAHRNHLRAVALRLLGSPADADDAVQEAWLHLSRAGGAGVANLGGWLATVVARICLDMLRSRRAHPHEELDEGMVGTSDADPEDEAIAADAVGLALQVVLDRLAPSERVALVLHDVFAVPFEEIAPVVGRTPAAARQLASRARRRVRGDGTLPDADPDRRRAVVAAFLTAARGGDLGALLAVLDPDVVVRADATAVRMGARAETRGAQAVGAFFATRARGARPALLDGLAGAVWMVRGRLLVAFRFTVEGGRVAALDLVADRDRLGCMDVVLTED